RRPAAAAAVAIAGIDEHVYIRPCHLDALGDRQRAAMDGVESIGFHEVRKAAGAADARDKNGFFRAEVLITTETLHRRENGVVTASSAPARHAALIILKLVMLIEHPQEAFGGMNGHGTCSSPLQFFEEDTLDRIRFDRLAAHLAPAIDVNEVT